MAFQRVKRVDAGETLAKPVKTGNGWLKVDARLTRTGIFEYRNADGTVRRELRTADEVFKADALQSFALVPVTDEHPPSYLTADNTKEHARGSMGETIRRDGEFVVGTMLVTDAGLVKKLEDGEAQQVSCGYMCDLEPTPGTHKGERYDAVQRNIRGNHVAIVPFGRAGEAARVRMDDALQSVIRISESHPDQEQPVKTIRIDGIDYEQGTDAAAQAFARFAERRDAAEKKLGEDVAAAKKEAEKATARADAAEAQVKKLEADLKLAPEKIREEVRARMDLEEAARNVLGRKAKFDGADNRAVRLRVLAKLAPEFKAEGRSDDYVSARFDAELDNFEPDAVAAVQAKARKVVQGRTDAEERQDEEDVEHDDAEDGDDDSTPSMKAYEKMRADNRELWNPKKSA